MTVTDDVFKTYIENCLLWTNLLGEKKPLEEQFYMLAQIEEVGSECAALGGVLKRNVIHEKVNDELFIDAARVVYCDGDIDVLNKRYPLVYSTTMDNLEYAIRLCKSILRKFDK